jgi:hypothetical protein
MSRDEAGLRLMPRTTNGASLGTVTGMNVRTPSTSSATPSARGGMRRVAGRAGVLGSQPEAAEIAARAASVAAAITPIDSVRNGLERSGRCGAPPSLKGSKPSAQGNALGDGRRPQHEPCKGEISAGFEALLPPLQGLCVCNVPRPRALPRAVELQPFRLRGNTGDVPMCLMPPASGGPSRSRGEGTPSPRGGPFHGPARGIARRGPSGCGCRTRTAWPPRPRRPCW